MDQAMVDSPITLRVSDIAAWPQCPRKFWLGKNWTNGRFTPAFFIGTGVHRGLEAYYRNGYSIECAQDAVTDYHRERKENFQYEYVQTWDEVDGEGLIDTIHRLIEHYGLFDRENHLVGDVIHDDEGPIIERRMEHPILSLDGTPLLDSRGRPIILSGQCDLALDRGGNTYIVDHKTFSTATLQRERPEESMEVDEQLTAYCYLWWRTYGEIPKAVVYNVIVKETPRMPEVLKNGSLSMNKAQYTSAALFRQAVRDHGLSITPYLNHIAWLEQQGFGRFFQRWQSSRNVYELQTFERKLALKTMDILRIVENPDLYAHSAGSTYRCGGCQFISPCKAYDDGGDGDAVLENQFVRKPLWVIE